MYGAGAHEHVVIPVLTFCVTVIEEVIVVGAEVIVDWVVFVWVGSYTGVSLVT